MSRNLTIELPFTATAEELLQKISERAQKAGARLEFDDSGMAGTFQVRKLIFTVAGTFYVSPPAGQDAGGTARVNVATAPPFVTDDQIRNQLTTVFAEMDS